VMRSAHQAKEIVDRRLKYVNETITKYEEERKMYLDRLEGMKRLLDDTNEGCFEIRETMPSDRDQQKKVRIAHKPSSTRKASQDVAVASGSGSKNQIAAKKVSDKEFADLMNRLDELDFEERSGKTKVEATFARNDNVAADDTNASTSLPVSNSGRKVMWRDDTVTETFSDVGSVEQAPSTSGITFNSDSDARPTKSILKNRDEHTPVGDVPPSPYEHHQKVISSVTEEAFSGKVLERVPFEPPSETQPQEPVRRVSRFAQERAQLKKQ